ncbi:MAG: hypothetical protein K6A30_01180 [Lachnospiraceae bacterium]|nr:hypothetical protein [Lachnospiraceae bacterium]
MGKYLETIYLKRFRVLAVWGALVGALAWSGISSWTHVVPTWLVYVVAISTVLVAILFVAGAKYHKKHRCK